MIKNLKVFSVGLFLSAGIALFLHSCEMQEETRLNPEIIITNPENNTEIVRGSTIKITAQLKDFSQYYKVHSISLTAGDSTLMQKEDFVPQFSYSLSTSYLTVESSTQISAKVRYTNEKPEDKNWNYFSVRDHYEDYVEGDTNKVGADTLKANTSITISLSGHPGSKISMDFVSFSPDTMTVENDTLIVDSMEVGKYEVTNQQYTKFMNSIGVDSTGCYEGIKYIFLNGTTGITYNGENFISGNGWESLPVVNVTWVGANSFCQWMGGRLPTEKEWYYASKPYYPYGGSDYSLDEVAWYKENSNGQLHAVGIKTPNAYGLFDMTGNAAEWCLNGYNDSSKVYKGGHWNSPATDLKTSARFHLPPNKAGNYLGFRVLIPQ
ncbi:MAG: formylglycine-generating enzyme family protein [Bacteroidales bacterium]|nr:formylglycine-generating enzyme family protein [Bacteroidales bacterium]